MIGKFAVLVICATDSNLVVVFGAQGQADDTPLVDRYVFLFGRKSYAEEFAFETSRSEDI